MNPDLSRLLDAAVSGDTRAQDRLLPLLYDDLRTRVRAATSPRAMTGPLDTAGLVQDAYMTLYRRSVLQPAQRPHFLSLAARALHQLLLEHARNGDGRAVLLSDGNARITLDGLGLLELDARLASLPERVRAAAHCRLFAGMDDNETAAALGVSDRTVRRDRAAARAALHQPMDAKTAAIRPPLDA